MVETELQRSYDALLTEVKSYSMKNSDQLLKLKEMFKEVVDSPRRLHYIKDLNDLIDVLERRLSLDCLHIKPLEYIVTHCCLTKIMKPLIRHHELIIKYNSSLSKQQFVENEFDIKTNSDHLIPLSVVEYISKRLGGCWEDLARELQLNEREIDTIDKQFETYQEKSQKVLSEFISRDSCNSRARLINALSNIQRIDLKNAVEDMLMKTCVSCRLAGIKI